MKNKGEVIVVVGGQWGSESKGEVVAQICRERNAEACVRTGAINAGHTVYYEGKPYKMQQIPVGWVNPQTLLVIGAGAYVSREILENEINMINLAMPGHDVRDRLYIDKRAGVHLQEHHAKEAGMHERMGSTAEGCMAAATDKMERRAGYKTFFQHALGSPASNFGSFVDTEKMLNDMYDDGGTIVLEGTQGTLLDLHLGDYPYVTSRQTHASAWLAEAGLSPTLHVTVVMVVRSFPIRVAGNSGPFPSELGWADMADGINSRLAEYGQTPLVSPATVNVFRMVELTAQKDLGMPVKPVHEYTPEERATYSTELSILHKKVLETLNPETVTELKKLFEMTTVTKKLRRIARLHEGTLKKAARINRPSIIALTFFNYQFPETWGTRSWSELMLMPDAHLYREYLGMISEATGARVEYINTSATSMIKLPIDAYETDIN